MLGCEEDIHFLIHTLCIHFHLAICPFIFQKRDFCRAQRRPPCHTLQLSSTPVISQWDQEGTVSKRC